MPLTADKTTFSEHLDAFKKIVGDPYVYTDSETLNIFAKDETENLYFLPDIVIKPRRQKR